MAITGTRSVTTISSTTVITTTNDGKDDEYIKFVTPEMKKNKHAHIISDVTGSGIKRVRDHYGLEMSYDRFT